MSKMTSRGRNLGFVQTPKSSCSDPHCPFHGSLSIRGKILTGTVKSDKLGNAVVVERALLVRDPKYDRYLRKYSRISAHNPACIQAKEGDIVRIGECRKISKNIAFCVLEKVNEATE